MDIIEFRPQPGKQEQFLSCPADIVFYGGAAGGGKTFAILMECLRYIHIPDFSALIFRKNLTHINAPGGLTDESRKIYPYFGGEYRENPKMKWMFPSGSKIMFDHLQHEKNMYDWMGSQIPLLIFDEVTHFSESVFWYMMSRNRSTCGVKPYIRGTCNPDPDSWVAKFIKWYIDQETGYPIEERSGVIRYFVRKEGDLIWGDTREELVEMFPELKAPPKSFAFISASLNDNRILMEKDPGYLANLEALPKVEREQLLKGNWKIKPAPGLYFKEDMFQIVDYIPTGYAARGWDLAATDETGDDRSNYTASVKMVKDAKGIITVVDMTFDRLSPGKVQNKIVNTTSTDGKKTIVRLPRDPGQAGVDQAYNYKKKLIGYPVKFRNMRENKILRALPFSQAAEHGMIRVLRAPWNREFFKFLEQFPPKKGSPDVVDAAVEAFDEVSSSNINLYK